MPCNVIYVSESHRFLPFRTSRMRFESEHQQNQKRHWVVKAVVIAIIMLKVALRMPRS